MAASSVTIKTSFENSPISLDTSDAIGYAFTNTSGASQNVTFTDTLPAGVTLDNPIGTTLTNGSSSGCSVVSSTAAPGSVLADGDDHRSQRHEHRLHALLQHCGRSTEQRRRAQRRVQRGVHGLGNGCGHDRRIIDGPLQPESQLHRARPTASRSLWARSLMQPLPAPQPTPRTRSTASSEPTMRATRSNPARRSTRSIRGPTRSRSIATARRAAATSPRRSTTPSVPTR